MNSEAKGKPESLGRLRHSPWAEPRLANRSVKEEMRENLLCGLGEGGTLFPGIHGYEDTVIPQIVNAILARHNFILLGLRGQAKSRIRSEERRVGKGCRSRWVRQQ